MIWILLTCGKRFGSHLFIKEVWTHKTSLTSPPFIVSCTKPRE